MTAPTYWLETLGCAKNQVDSEKVQLLLAEAGYGMAPSPEGADVVMVNTCAFIEDARRESVETILGLNDLKKPGAPTVVLGCMAQRFGTELGQALPEVDSMLGLDRYGELVGVLDSLTSSPQWRPIRLRKPAMDILHLVRRPTPIMPYAYVKVAEGCDKPCTFCAIPLIRGKQRSRQPQNVVKEVQGLVDAGVTEVVLVAQDLAAYGRDLDARGDIVDLLRMVSQARGLRMLRLLYLYPKEIRPRLIEEMTTNPLMAPYFDLSLQHSSPRLLRSMKRPGGSERYLELIKTIRDAHPEPTLRSSFIVGFPGETEDDVSALATFLEDAALDWAGFFPYSPEEGTPAASLEARVDEREVGERLRYLQSVQDDLTASANLDQVGRRHLVLVDQMEDGIAVGRSYRQAPEIDGVITLDRGTPGDWVEVEIKAALGADLEGIVIG
ncbi:MAG TPA: 30S ribosomal protein S12 methylthiotransferase RimO [Acidimicrobiia bacterium]|nr:30S ribosomal protein S12 methylthiotransferase RimO [Acidimicrobiia bacterium]